MSYPQTTTASGIRVACTFRPIRPASPRSSSLRLSSPLLYLCVGQKQSKARQRKAKQRKAKQRKAKKSKANQRRLSVWLSVSYPQTTTTSGMRVACTFRPIRPSSPRLALPLFSSPLFFYLCVCRIGAEQSKAMQRKAKQRKAKQRKAKQSNVVCRSVC